MSFDFPAILVILIVFTGTVTIGDIFYCWLKKENRKDEEISANRPVIIDYARAFFPVFLIVFLIRSFLVQPYHVPSRSLEPTIIPGDFILVN